jgi:pre-rRNA-processing protein TSR2
VEDLLLQVMSDEFGTTLEDESETEVARAVVKIRDEILLGDFSTVDAMWEAFRTRQGPAVRATKVGRDSESEDSVDLESGEEDESDTDMNDAPELSRPKEKYVAETDDDGFTKVVGRRR